MKTCMSVAFIVLLIGAGQAFGQDPVEEKPISSSLIVDTSPVDCGDPCCARNGNRFYARAEYLLWWLKDAPLPPSLVTTGPVTDNPGALGHGGIPLTGNE